LRPIKKGLSGLASCWKESRERMKGMQCGDLSSIMVSVEEGGAVIVEGAWKEREADEEVIGEGEDINPTYILM
jgi:hypothetical protein